MNDLITVIDICIVVVHYHFHRCPKRIIVAPSNGAIGGQSAGTNSTSKTSYAEEGRVGKSSHESGHCKQFGDAEPARDDGNTPAATAITTESPDNSTTDDSSSKPTPNIINTDFADKQHLKRNTPVKTSVSQLLGWCRPKAVLGMHGHVNPVYHSTVEVKVVPWEQTCTAAAVKEDAAYPHTADKQVETTRHACLFV